MSRLPQEFVVLDTETGGVSSYTDALLQVAAVQFRDGVEMRSYNALIKPDLSRLRVTEKAVSIHGLTPDKLEGGKAEVDAFDGLKRFFQEDCGYGRDKENRPWVIGQSIKFDINFLKAAGDRSGTPLWYFVNPMKVLDILQAYRLAQHCGWMPPGSAKLEEMAKALGLPAPDGSYHDALVDCRITGDVFITLYGRLGWK